MITLMSMNWSNFFSYGENNKIDFTKDRVTQVLGINGTGKSSIPLILEEILYGKNSKGVKKNEIPNRYTQNNELYADLEFEKDNDTYKIVLRRKSSIKLSLFKNGSDISEHTSTGTYKSIEHILGMNFKTFSQLIYQSSNSNLQFLTATDSNRKSFLISLLALDKYIAIQNIFKEKYKEVSKSEATITGKYSVLKSWIDKHKNIDTNILDLLTPIDSPDDSIGKKTILQESLDSIGKENKKISQNNKYKELLSTIDMEVLSDSVEKPNSAQPYVSEKEVLQRDITSNKNKLKQLKSLTSAVCHTCKQNIDEDIKNNMVRELEADIAAHEAKLLDINNEIQKLIVHNKRYKAHVAATQEFERLSLLIDKDMKTDLLDAQELKDSIDSLTLLINNTKAEIKKVNDKNKIISEHNSKAKVVTEQLEDYENQVNIQSELLEQVTSELVYIDILRKSFSTTGLIGYKIEYMIKDLEREINTYLQEFSEGNFILTFILKGDKLNIEINDNGKIVDVNSLSTGELARVNISTLLAIRKIMSELSDSKINVLFLDEIMGVLDAYGKEKLIESLLEEQNLNTFIVSHDYTHPLLEKLTIIKEDRISRIEEYG